MLSTHGTRKAYARLVRATSVDWMALGTAVLMALGTAVLMALGTSSASYLHRVLGSDE